MTMSILNHTTRLELFTNCDSELWAILRFAWGPDVVLGPQRISDGLPVRDILPGCLRHQMAAPALGTVTWLE